MAKLSTGAKAETSQESPPDTGIQGKALKEIQVLEAQLTKQVSRLKAQGEYNVDAADNLMRTQALLKLTVILRVLLTEFDLTEHRRESP